jgi:hypothetical protein
LLGAPLPASASYVSDFVKAKAVQAGYVMGSFGELHDPQSEFLLEEEISPGRVWGVTEGHTQLKVTQADGHTHRQFVLLSSHARV